MAKNIKIELASTNEDIYFDSFFIVNQLLKENNVYPSSQKRIMMSKFLYGIMMNNEQIGFVSASSDEKYYSDVLVLDLCILKPYRKSGIANTILPRVLTAIEHNNQYSNEFVIIEKTRSHDDQIKGIKYSDNVVLLQNRLDEMNYIHPDGIERNKRVISGREAFGNSQIKGEKR